MLKNLLISVPTVLAATANPFVTVFNGILNDAKGWIYGAIGTITVLVVIIEGVKYQSGSSMEKNECVTKIRKTIIMGGGIFFLAWLVMYVIGKMQVAA